MLLGLGFASMTAATLADQRRQLGVYVDVVDPSAVAAAAAAPSGPGMSAGQHGRAAVDPLDVLRSTQVMVGV
jgi:hypothetical protein